MGGPETCHSGGVHGDPVTAVPDYQGLGNPDPRKTPIYPPGNRRADED